MAFRSANIAAHMLRFNSAVSSDFLDFYTNLIEKEIVEDDSPKHKTFAPSQMRCDRVSWFRLRGTQPDRIKTPDTMLNFTAQIGTCCHEAIQKRLSEALGDKWITVNEWIRRNPEAFSEYDWDIEQKGYESLLNMTSPYPVRFACDGIIEVNGTVYLLEIKTAESSSLADLIEPKAKHIDQIRCYATLLHIPHVLFLYQDRQYGQLKCFEVTVTQGESEELLRRMNRILELVDANIAPEGLPKGDPDCSQNMCPYYIKCKEWGRY